VLKKKDLFVFLKKIVKIALQKNQRKQRNKHT